MKKFISFILLIIFLFIGNGYYFLFKYLQHNIHQEIKYEIKNGFKEKKLSLVIVSSSNANELVWIKNEKEFQYQGAMYDVVRTEIKGQKKYYYCINDVKEKQLIEHFTKTQSRKKNILWNPGKIISTKYFPEKFSLKANSNASDYHFAAYNRYYQSTSNDVASPPPKIYLFS